MLNSIKSRLLALTFAMVASSLFGYYQLDEMGSQVHERQAEVDLSYEVLAGYETLTSHLSDAESGVRGFLLTGDEDYLEAFSEGKEQVHVNESDLKRFFINNARATQQLHKITHLLGRKLDLMARSIDLYRSGHSGGALLQVDRSKRTTQVIDNLFDKARLDESVLLGERKLNLDQAMRKQMNFAIFWLFLNVLIAIFIITLLFNRILRPIAKIMHMAHDFKDGILEDRLSFKHNDELGDLGHTFIEMADELEGQHLEMRDKEALNRHYTSMVAMLSAANERDMALAEVLAMISMNFPAPVGAIYLLDASGSDLKLAMAHGIDELALESTALSTSLLGETVKSDEFFEVKHLQQAGVLIDTGLAVVEPHSVLLIPIVYRAKSIGVMALALLQDLSDLQLNVLSKLVNDIAVAMKDMERFAQLKILNEALEVSREQLQQERDSAVEDSITDGLTKIYNRGYLDISLPVLLKTAKRQQDPLSLFMLDIDYFKKVNDNYGHAAGDEVLRCVAKSMRDHLREIDFVARYGGEEFICILPNTDVASANIAANKLREVIQLATYSCMDGKSVSASMGVATLNDNDESLNIVIERADKALYEAKKSGRNRVVCG
ncbi:MAG: diguanylate cyclase [Mariprofundaceae bacterium]